MKTAVYYFSATGNTERAVRLISERLEAAGREVFRQMVDGHTPPASEIPGLTLIVFPVWAWAAPHFMLDFVRSLPKAKGAQAAVFATCGGFGAQAVGEVSRLLRRRGYEVIAGGEAVYPDSWVMAVDPPKGAELDSVLAAGDAQVAQFAAGLASGQPPVSHCAWGHVLWSWPISRLFRTAGRRFMGKWFIADEQCTSCGLCVRNCPVQAIRMEGTPARPRWSASCAACYRCINLCPVRAIQVSMPLMILHLVVNLALTIVCLGSIGWIHRHWVPLPGWTGTGLSALAAVLLLAVATMLQLTALDPFFHWLATRPALRGFFRSSYTHRFGRYAAPGFHSPLPNLHGQTEKDDHK